MNTINAKKRSKTDKLVDIRKEGFVPAVVYGASTPNTSISVPAIDFEKIFRMAGESSTIVLDIEGSKVDVLIHEVQMDPVKDTAIHIDFLAVDMNKPVEVAVSLSFTGVAPAEKAGLGTLVKVLHEVEIEALPKDLPQNIEVSIESLTTLEDQIHVKDIKLPSGVTMVTGADEVVALVAAQKEEVESEPVDLSSIEVEKKGKQEEEGAEASSEGEKSE